MGGVIYGCVDDNTSEVPMFIKYENAELDGHPEGKYVVFEHPRLNRDVILPLLFKRSDLEHIQQHHAKDIGDKLKTFTERQKIDMAHTYQNFIYALFEGLKFDTLGTLYAFIKNNNNVPFKLAPLINHDDFKTPTEFMRLILKRLCEYHALMGEEIKPFIYVEVESHGKVAQEEWTK